VRAAALLAGGDTAAAAGAVAGLQQRDDLPLDVRVDAGLLSAACALTEGRTDGARWALDRALALAATERLRRPVVEPSPRPRPFLRDDRTLTERHAWLGAAVLGEQPARASAPRAGSAATGGTGGVGQPVVEALPAR